MASEDTDTETGPPKPALENLRSALDDEIPRLNAYSTEIANIHRTILGARAAAPQIADHVQQEMFRRYDELYQDVHTSFQSIVDRAHADHDQYQADRAQYLQEMELYRRGQGRAENIAELSRGALQAEPTDLRRTAGVTEAAATDVSHDVPVQPVSSSITPDRPNDMPQVSRPSTTRDSQSRGTTPSYLAQTASSIARRQPRPMPSMTSMRSLTHITAGNPSEEGQLSATSGQSGPAGTTDPNVGTTARGGAKPIRPSSSTTGLAKQSSSASLRPDFQSQSAVSHPDRTRTLAAIHTAKRPASTPEPAKGSAKRRNVSSETDQPLPLLPASGIGSGVGVTRFSSDTSLSALETRNRPSPGRIEIAQSAGSGIIPGTARQSHGQARQHSIAETRPNTAFARQQAPSNMMPFSSPHSQGTILPTSPSASHMQLHPSSTAASSPESAIATLPASVTPAVYQQYRPYSHPSVSWASLPPGASQDDAILEAFDAQRHVDADFLAINGSTNNWNLQNLEDGRYKLNPHQINIYSMIEKPQGWTIEEEKLLREHLRSGLKGFKKLEIEGKVQTGINSGKFEFPGRCFLLFHKNVAVRRDSNRRIMISECPYASQKEHQEHGCWFLTFSNDCDPIVISEDGHVNLEATQANLRNPDWKSKTDINGHRYYLFRRLTDQDLARARQNLQEEHDLAVAQSMTVPPIASIGDYQTVGNIPQETLAVPQDNTGTFSRALTMSGGVPMRRQDVTALGETLASTSIGGRELAGSAVQGDQGRPSEVIGSALGSEIGGRSDERQAVEEVVEDEDMYGSPLPSSQGI